MSKFKQLEDAGLIKPGSLFSRDQYDAIEGLSEEEVKTLITIAGKLNETFAKRSPHIEGTIMSPAVNR